MGAPGENPLLFLMQLCYVLNTKSSVLSALEFLASDKKRAVSVLERLKVNWMTVIVLQEDPGEFAEIILTKKIDL